MDLIKMEINDFVNLNTQLSSSDKTVRRKALNVIEESLFQNPSEENVVEALPFLEDQLVARLSDESEINRTLAGTLIYNFCSNGVITDRLLAILIPVISHRFKGPSIEESEDVKLLFMDIVNTLSTDKCRVNLQPFFDDLIDINKMSLCEKCPDILLKSCEFTCLLSFSVKEKFSMRSDALAISIVKLLSNQRFKVRAKAINALGCILVNGVVHAIDDVVVPLSKCSLDICQVRQQLLLSGHFVATKMGDRYSYWKKILPLLLFGLRDEDDETRLKANELWSEVGAQYMEENKDSGNFNVSGDSEYFPQYETKFNIGCQTLVHNIFGALLPSISYDMGDWQVDTRLHASKLLTVLILNVQRNCVQYADGIFQALFTGISDQDNRIVTECFKCAEYLGHFLPPDLYVTILELHAEENPEKSAKILLALLQGTPTAIFETHLCSILTMIEDLRYSLDLVNDPEALLDILQIIIEKVEFKEIPFSIVMPLLKIQGTTNPLLKKRVTVVFNELGVKCGKKSYQEVISLCMKKIISNLRKEEEFWTKDSSDLTLLIVLSGCDEFEDYFDLIVPLLSKQMRMEEAPFVTFQLLQSVKAMVDRISVAKPTHALKWAKYLIEGHINLMLPWSAGNTSEGLRTAAMSTIVSLLKNFHGNPKAFSVLSFCIRLLPALIKDDSGDTRILTCNFIQAICVHFRSLITDMELINFMRLIITRLEDSTVDGRRVAALTLSKVSTHIIPDNLIEKSYSKRSNDEQLSDVLEEKMDLDLKTKDSNSEDENSVGELVELIPVILPYLDEQDQQIQTHLLDTLQSIGRCCPESLIQELESKGSKFDNAHLCLDLLKQLKESNQTNMECDT